jgi:hypothetical protein
MAMLSSLVFVLEKSVWAAIRHDFGTQELRAIQLDRADFETKKNVLVWNESNDLRSNWPAAWSMLREVLCVKRILNWSNTYLVKGLLTRNCFGCCYSYFY